MATEKAEKPLFWDGKSINSLFFLPVVFVRPKQTDFIYINIYALFFFFISKHILELLFKSWRNTSVVVIAQKACVIRFSFENLPENFELFREYKMFFSLLESTRYRLSFLFSFIPNLYFLLISWRNVKKLFKKFCLFIRILNGFFKNEKKACLLQIL